MKSVLSADFVIALQHLYWRFPSLSLKQLVKRRKERDVNVEINLSVQFSGSTGNKLSRNFGPEVMYRHSPEICNSAAG